MAWTFMQPQAPVRVLRVLQCRMYPVAPPLPATKLHEHATSVCALFVLRCSCPVIQAVVLLGYMCGDVDASLHVLTSMSMQNE